MKKWKCSITHMVVSAMMEGKDGYITADLLKIKCVYNSPGDQRFWFSKKGWDLKF